MGSTKHPTKTCAAILKLVRDQGADLPGPDHHYRIERTRAGHWQRSEGAWSWSLDWVRVSPDDQRPYQTYNQIGSAWPATECAKAGSIFDGVTITPKAAMTAPETVDAQG